jgi:signal transduction histidine kinase
VLRPLKPYQLVVDLVVAVLFALVIIPVEAVSGVGMFGGSWAASGAGLVFAAALAVRRLSPGGSLAIAWAGAALQMALLLGPRPSDVAIFAVLYATAAYGSRVVYWVGFGSAIGGAVVITVYLFVVINGVTLATLPTAIAVMIAALFALLLSWTAGALVRTAMRARETRLAQQRAEADAAAEQERVRIARDMHDVVAHSLAVVIAQADGARYALAAGSGAGGATDSDAASGALQTISSTARSALADVRLLLTQLRHSEAEGPQPRLADLDGLYEQVRAAGVDLRVEVDPAPRAEPAAGVQLAVYRILQEALTNALRHGDGGPVALRLAWLADRVEVEVRNDAAVRSAAGTGHGLIGMRERAQLAGGRFDAGAEGTAFVVRATLPVGGGAP